jgi:hypothetical protein
MTGEPMLTSKIVDVRNRRNDRGNLDIKVVDRYMDSGSITPVVTPVSASKG